MSADSTHTETTHTETTHQEIEIVSTESPHSDDVQVQSLDQLSSTLPDDVKNIKNTGITTIPFLERIHAKMTSLKNKVMVGKNKKKNSSSVKTRNGETVQLVVIEEDRSQDMLLYLFAEVVKNYLITEYIRSSTEQVANKSCEDSAKTEDQ